MMGQDSHATAAAPVQPGAVVAAWAYGLIVAAGVGHFLLGIPIQLSDCYGNMLKLTAPWRELMVNEFTQHAFLRPFLWAELKLVYDASGGNFYEWFRGVHVAQIFALIMLYLTLVRPATWRDAALLSLGVAVLFGLHTFRYTVTEAFPINTFLTIVLCCAAAANLSLMHHRWWVDVLAALLFIVAALTVESGLVVWAIFGGAALAGARGVSKAGLAVLAALLVGYFVLRFPILHVGVPELTERSSGFGFRSLEPHELMAQFGQNRTPFYIYNVVTSALSVLFSEPRGGVFRLTYGLLNHPEPSAIVNVIASACATLLVAVFAWRRRHAWLARRFDRCDQIVLLFLMVLAANAAISYPYTKDVIMSPAGFFFAAAVFVAAREVLPAAATDRLGWRSAGVIALCVVLGATWAIRFASLPLNLREAGRKIRNEWAYVDDWLMRQNIAADDSHARTLRRRLQSDALYNAHPHPPGLAPAFGRIFDID